MFNITFQQVEAFLTVGNYVNLSKAAESMFISQSALSKMLQRFEDGLNMQLFYRSNQGLTFTDEGKFLYSKLSMLYQSVNNTIKTAQNLSITHTKILHIAAPTSFDSSPDFSTARGFVERYQDENKEIQLSYALHEFGNLRRMLEQGEADIAFALDFSIEDMKGISYKRISGFELCIAVSKKNSIAEQDELNYSLLSNEKFFTVPIPDVINDISYTLQRCRRLGFVPKSIEFVPNMQTLLFNVRQNKGMAICGRFSMLGYEDIKYYPLPSPENQTYVVGVWQSGKLTREAQKLVDMLPDGEVFENV